jgi:hypothetical protein
MSKVPEIPSNICDISRKKAINRKHSLYIRKVFGFSCHTALKNSKPERNHSPSGRLQRKKPANKDELENIIVLLRGKKSNHLYIRILPFLKK